MRLRPKQWRPEKLPYFLYGHFVLRRRPRATFRADYAAWRYARELEDKEYLTSFDRRVRKTKKVAPFVGGAIAALLLVGGVIVRYEPQPDGSGPTRPAPALPANPNGVAGNGLSGQSTLRQVEEAFGPFRTQTNPDNTPANAIVLLRQSSAIDVSNKRIEFKPQEWMATEPFTLNAVVRDGVVIVTSGQGTAYTVGIEQPFILETDPGRAHLLTIDGQVWTTPVQDLRITDPDE